MGICRIPTVWRYQYNCSFLYLIHSYLAYPAGPGPGTTHNFEMFVTMVTLNQIRPSGGRAKDLAHDGTISTKIPLKLTHRIPGKPR